MLDELDEICPVREGAARANEVQKRSFPVLGTPVRVLEAQGRDKSDEATTGREWRSKKRVGS